MTLFRSHSLTIPINKSSIVYKTPHFLKLIFIHAVIIYMSFPILYIYLDPYTQFWPFTSKLLSSGWQCVAFPFSISIHQSCFIISIGFSLVFSSYQFRKLSGLYQLHTYYFPHKYYNLVSFFFFQCLSIVGHYNYLSSCFKLSHCIFFMNILSFSHFLCIIYIIVFWVTTLHFLHGYFIIFPFSLSFLWSCFELPRFIFYIIHFLFVCLFFYYYFLCFPLALCRH